MEEELVESKLESLCLLELSELLCCKPGVLG